MQNPDIFKTIYSLSAKSGLEIYAVGGYVRDNIMGENKITDIDFVVLGSGIDFANEFDAFCTERKILNTGQQSSLIEFPDFDTARVVIYSKTEEGDKKVDFELEFAGARVEQYQKNSRKPQVQPTDLENDLGRRDFTINAMARKVIKNGLSKKIIDPYGGRLDLKNKIIKTPLDPDSTFSDDPLRMLRAVRFSARFGFEIELNTYQAIIKNKDRIKIVSAERIKEEFFKILATDKPSNGLWVLYKTGLFNFFLPEINDLYGVEEVYGYGHKNNLNHTFKVVDNVAQKTDKTLLRFAALLHDIGKPGTKKFIKGRGWSFDMHEHLGYKMTKRICARLRLSKDESAYVSKLVRWHQQPIALMDEGVTDSAIRRLAINLGDYLPDLLLLAKSDITTGNPKKLAKRMKNYEYLAKRMDEVIEKDKLRAFQSPVRGEEIMEMCGLKPGPTVGKIKKDIENAILDGKIPNEYNVAKEYFFQIKDKYLEKAGDWEKE